MKCLRKEQIVQCRRFDSGGTQEEPGLESPHSAMKFQAPEALVLDRVNQKVQVKWPTVSKKREWQQFGEDVTRITSNIWKSDADSCLQALTTVIVNYGAERFSQEDEEIIKTP